MRRVVVFGNSGSGKSSYAKELVGRLACPHMDLDTVAWVAAAKIPARRAFSESRLEILNFTDSAEDWVVEGCYADLLEVAIAQATEIVFLNPGSDVCVGNAKNRPWEPHKYASPEAQNANLAMLVEWIRQYEQRSDEFSYLAHRRLFEGFIGPKREFNSNEREK